jgi:anti-sigma regulatory factor (Ser/Thr protein kinase)
MRAPARRSVLHEWGLREITDDAAVIVSELMTNAQRASAALDSRPPIALRVLADAERLVIEAWDRCPLDVQPATADEDAEYGRGVPIVQALSNRWGQHRIAPNLKAIWAEVQIPRPTAGPHHP